MTVPLQQALCRSLDTGMEQPVVWQTGPVPGQVLRIRPVSLHNDADLNVIHDWLTDLFPGLRAGQLRLLFELIAESTFMQAFMVLQQDDKPVGQLEVYDVTKDEMKDAYQAKEGDFRLCVPVLFSAEVLLGMLQAAIPFFFSFPEVQRVVWVVSVADAGRNRIAGKAGFYHLHTMARPANLYCIDRPVAGPINLI